MTKNYLMIATDTRDGEYEDPCFRVIVGTKAKCVVAMMKRVQEDAEDLSDYDVSAYGGDAIDEFTTDLYDDTLTAKDIIGRSYKELGEPMKISFRDPDGGCITYKIEQIEG